MYAPALRILRHIFSIYWRAARWTTLFVLAATLAGSIATVASPYFFSRAVDVLANGSEADGATRILFLYALLFGIALAFGQASRFLVLLCAERLSFIADSAFFSRLLRKTPAFFLDHNPTEIGVAQREGAHTLNIVTQLGVGGLLPGLVQIASGVALLGRLLSWETAAIVGVYGLFAIGLDYYRVARVKPSLDAAIARNQDTARLVGNAVVLIDTLRQTRGEAWVTQRFAIGAREAFSNWRRYALISSAFCGASGVAVTLQLAVTFLILVPRYKAGLLSIGDIVLFNMLMLQLNEPFRLVGMAIKETVEAAARFRPMLGMWSAPETVEPADPVFYRAAEGTIAFEDVAFHYPNGRGVKQLSFEIERGTLAFLTGETGSGKTTVLKLLLKGLSPTQGRIVVDGIDLERVTSDNWFSHVGIVPQDVALLNDSLSTNIVLGRPFDAALLRLVAEQASILSRIDAMPEGFDTIVGERGLKLSGGERQRIAIARALYGRPSVLILDEASSALDFETESRVMGRLRSLSDKLTILSVTHRIAMIRPTDQVIAVRPAI